MPRANQECGANGCGVWFRPRPEYGPLSTLYCRNHRKSTLPEIPMPVPVEAPEDPKVLALRASLNRTLVQLDKARASKEELVEAVRQSARDAASALALPAVIQPPYCNHAIESLGHKPETALAILADWQLGKKTPTYSSAVAEERMERYAEAVERITRIQRADHPVPDLRVYLLGDLVEGELIFPGQAHRIDSSLYRQVLVDGPRILSTFLRRMLAMFDRIHVVGVIGNHGRLGGPFAREMHPETNADAMLYEVTRMTVGDNEGRITWGANMTPGERQWYALDEVQGKRFFLFHGDQVRGGFGGFPWYGFGKALLPWKVKFGFDYSLSGHYHNPVTFSVGGSTHWGSGTLESDNTWALEELKAWGAPSQWLLFVHPNRGVSAQYEVKL